MQIYHALIMELPPSESMECTESQVYSAYFSTLPKAERALAQAWKTNTGLDYVTPVVDGFMHEAVGKEGYLYVAEIASIDVDSPIGAEMQLDLSVRSSYKKEESMTNGLPRLPGSESAPTLPHRVDFFKDNRLHHSVMAFTGEERSYFHRRGSQQGFTTANRAAEAS